MPFSIFLCTEKHKRLADDLPEFATETLDPEYPPQEVYSVQTLTELNVADISDLLDRIIPPYTLVLIYSFNAFKLVPGRQNNLVGGISNNVWATKEQLRELADKL